MASYLTVMNKRGLTFICKHIIETRMEYKTTEFGLILKDAVTACKSNFIQEIAANDYLAHTYGITVQNLLTIFEFH